MLNRRPSFSIPRTGSLKAENDAVSTTVLIRNLCLTLCAGAILVFTVIVAKYQPGNPFFRPPARLTTILRKFNSNGGEDSAAFTNIADFNSAAESESESTAMPIEPEQGNPASQNGSCRIDDPIVCHEFDVFHTLMRYAIEEFRDIEFYQFGKPVRGEHNMSCHMAWKFKLNERNAVIDKDYRTFTLVRSKNCTFRVVEVGDYRSGGNAIMNKKVGKPLKDNLIALPDVELEDELFSRGKYLLYTGGGDRGKSLNQYLWGFMCTLGEAQYLNRTLVLDLDLSLSTKRSEDKVRVDFRFYFDYEHLRDSAEVMEQSQFWSKWRKREQTDGLTLHSVEGFKVTPMKLASVEETLIVRKLDPENFWFQVCEGEAKPVIQRPWRKLWKARYLIDISVSIAARMNGDYVSLNIERGEKVKNHVKWPNLDKDTLPGAILSKLERKIEKGSIIYITTNEANTTFFDALKGVYTVHFLDDHRDLWDSQSDWYEQMMKLNKGKEVEFDEYMRASVDMEVFLKGKKKIETFNDLTKDCKDGVDTCTSNT